MSEKSEPNDPWAPPESRAPQDRVELGKQPANGQQPPARPQPPRVHDQPTMTSMPTGGFGPEDGGEIPPPPTAPGGPAQPAPGPYGYPAPAPAPAPAPVPAGGGYGYPGYPGYSGQAPYGAGGWQQSTPSNGMGITAMVLGIVSVVAFCMWGIGIIPGVLALIFGVVGRKRAQRGEANNGGMAVAGIVLGAIGTVISAAFLAFLIWAVVQGGKNGADYDTDPFATSLVVAGASR
ncbi:DUF4190 domain-containing protein [Streptomyces sp. HMX112]|uniref:DUF4190 domain-containing protein n=1 Tax=Streptomyces sp. HMX112 TaxID=3390850 RepID=UPI003A80DEC5